MSSAPVILNARLNDQLQHKQLNKTIKKRIKPTTVTHCPKWNTDMTIQSQVLSIHWITSLLYMLQCISQQCPSTCCLAAKPPKHSTLKVSRIREKPVIFLFSVGTDRHGTFAPAKTLLISGFWAKVFIPV